MLAVRWYLRFGLSYRDVEELLAERGVEVDHVTVYRWVQRFTPLLAEAARPCRHAVGNRWHVIEPRSLSRTQNRSELQYGRAGAPPWRHPDRPAGLTRSRIRFLSSTGTCCSWPSHGRPTAVTVLARPCWSRSVRAV